jgi:hypothetical protein
VGGAFQLVMSALKIEPKVTEAFRTGGGFDWNEHDPGFFEGQARFSTPNYKANLVTNWSRRKAKARWCKNCRHRMWLRSFYYDYGQSLS